MIVATGSPLDIAVAVEAGDWPEPGHLQHLAQSSAGAVLAETTRAIQAGTELSVVFSDDAEVARLNQSWRGKSGSTNVLSFPAATVPGVPVSVLGDIVLAAETVRREAETEGKPFEHHLSHLLVHGLLHLLGFDHENEAEAEEMEAIERRALARLAIPDPYV